VIAAAVAAVAAAVTVGAIITVAAVPTAAAAVAAPVAAAAATGDTSTVATAAGSCALDRAVARNLAAAWVLPPAAVDSILAAERGLPLPQRVGRWARRFLAADFADYRFGLAPGGYAAAGALVDDAHHDCISFLYRCSELARARDAADAVKLAIAQRFAGAPAEAVVGADGRVDYDHPAHLDFSLDMVRSGLWGADVTAELPGNVEDRHGSARYPPGSFRYLPRAAVADVDLREGDIVWFVLDPQHAAARGLRDEHGLVIGHVGIIVRDGGEPWLIHAARSALAGWYERPGVVRVPLAAYLERVERFAGVVVTRYSPVP
jgi:hypothetical protein